MGCFGTFCRYLGKITSILMQCLFFPICIISFSLSYCFYSSFKFIFRSSLFSEHLTNILICSLFTFPYYFTKINTLFRIILYVNISFYFITTFSIICVIKYVNSNGKHTFPVINPNNISKYYCKNIYTYKCEIMFPFFEQLSQLLMQIYTAGTIVKSFKSHLKCHFRLR